ncbi:unnamed protein product [Closterium sp. Naga37s-1]|nr:unnamed protein product [Closterium sp. Naga37s-1]
MLAPSPSFIPSPHRSSPLLTLPLTLPLPTPPRNFPPRYSPFLFPAPPPAATPPRAVPPHAPGPSIISYSPHSSPCHSVHHVTTHLLLSLSVPHPIPLMHQYLWLVLYSHDANGRFNSLSHPPHPSLPPTYFPVSLRFATQILPVSFFSHHKQRLLSPVLPPSHHPSTPLRPIADPLRQSGVSSTGIVAIVGAVAAVMLLAAVVWWRWGGQKQQPARTSSMDLGGKKGGSGGSGGGRGRGRLGEEKEG